MIRLRDCRSRPTAWCCTWPTAWPAKATPFAWNWAGAAPAGNFLVMSDVGADPADAPLLADDSPATQAALELFLGTQGWRRFVAAAKTEPAQFAKGDAAGTLFSAENLSPEQARAQLAARVERSLPALQQRIDRDQSQLADQRETATASVTAALMARDEYERWPSETFRLALGLLAAAALLVGGLCLI